MDQFGHNHEHGDEMGEDVVPVHESLTNLRRLNVSGEGGSSGGGGSRRPVVRYRECLKNHAVGLGGHALDGCGEFIAAGEDGTLESLTCAACNCHRNFHRKETDGESSFHPNAQFSPYYHRSPPPGFLHMALPPATENRHRHPLAMHSREDQDGMSNPSSSGGGGGGGVSTPGGSKKRFRTKFTAEQKEKMMELAERLGWRLQRQDDALVQQFCVENGVSRQVLKVWMHNNKSTLGKK
ncbi:unnamed protein product [Rhodiola kirilowii]